MTGSGVPFARFSACEGLGREERYRGRRFLPAVASIEAGIATINLKRSRAHPRYTTAHTIKRIFRDKRGEAEREGSVCVRSGLTPREPRERQTEIREREYVARREIRFPRDNSRLRLIIFI